LSGEAAPAPKKSRAGRDLPAALLVGFSLFFLVIFGCIYWPLGVALILALLSILGVFELRDALSRKDVNVAIVPLAVFVPVIIMSGCVSMYTSGFEYLPWVLTSLAVFVTMLWRLPGGEVGYIQDVAGSALIVGYLGLLGSFIGPVLAMDNGAAKLGAIFMAVCASDTGGYALGATIGKHQMAPQISPKKTWEGLVGSILLTVVVAGLMSHFALQQPWWLGVIFAVIVVFVGTAGDLVESQIKRDAGIKDMSSILPGHGGIMDRLDSILVTIPVGWAFFAIVGG
jgi:phosphatidate cytidylyltransferase